MLALAGCSTQSGGQDNDWGQVLDMVTGQFDTHTSIALKQAASVPYATLGVRGGRRAADDDRAGGRRDRRQAVDLQGPPRHHHPQRAAWCARRGLLRNVDAVNFPAGDPVLAAAAGAAPIETTRFVDFWDLNRFSVPLHCVAVSRGADPVTILGKSIATVRVDESCESSTMDWTFTDSFWVGVRRHGLEVGPAHASRLRSPGARSLPPPGAAIKALSSGRAMRGPGSIEPAIESDAQESRLHAALVRCSAGMAFYRAQKERGARESASSRIRWSL